MDVKNNYFYNNTQKLLTRITKFNKYTPWELVAVAPIFCWKFSNTRHIILPVSGHRQ